MQISRRSDWISEIQDTPCKVEHAASLFKVDYSHYLVWIDEPFNTNVLQHFHQKIMITSITYSIANHYYMRYLQRNRKTCKLRTEAENWNPMITSTNEFQQVTPFSLFHCASTVRQTKRKQALSVTLTHSNKTEMAYQVMRKIAENGCTYRSTNWFPDEKFILGLTLLTYSGYLHYNLGCIARNKCSLIQCLEMQSEVRRSQASSEQEG